MGGARLFSALVPAPVAVRSLREALNGVSRGAEATGLRWIPPRLWHITLGFYGSVDPEATAARLRASLTGLPAREVRIAGAGTFPGVLWTGVDGELADLASATGAEAGGRPFRPHLTLARHRERHPPRSLADALAGYRGPPWTADEVVLFASEPTAGGGPRYTPIERFGLGEHMR